MYATWSEDDAVDLEHDTRIFWVRGEDETVVGIIEEHNHNGGRSMGSVPIHPDYLPGGAHWQVTSGQAGTIDGLTLTPSIACHTCGHHGWIQDGHWVNA